MTRPTGLTAISRRSFFLGTVGVVSVAAAGSGHRPQVELASYSDLRDYRGTAVLVRLTEHCVDGLFQCDFEDRTSSDDSGITIVSVDGRRWKRIFEGPVLAKWFGAVGDGIADDTNAWLRLRSLAIARGSLVLRLEEGRTYTTRNPYVFNDILSLSILGSGAKWVNILGSSERLPLAAWAEALHFNQPFSTNGAQLYQGDNVHPYEPGHRIRTVAAGATRITLSDEGSSGIQPGNRVLIYGFDRQTTASYPPCANNFEIVNVTSVVGKTVSFHPPLRFEYRQDWRENQSGGVTFGAARVISLDRANNTMSRRVYIENLHFLANPAWSERLATAERNGRATFANIEHLHLKSVTTEGGIYIGSGSTQLLEDCRIAASLTIDKLVDYVHVVRSSCKNLTEGLGTRVVRVTRSKILDTVACGAIDELFFDQCDLPFEDGTTGGGYNNGGTVRRIKFHRPTWRIPSAVKKHLIAPSVVSAKFTVISPGTIAIPEDVYVSGNWARFVRAGGCLYKDGLPVWRLTSLPYLKGTDVCFPGAQLARFADGDTLAAPKVAEEIEVVSPTWFGSTKVVPSISPGWIISHPMLTKVSWLGHSGESITYTSAHFPDDLNEAGNASFRSLFGLWLPERVEIDVIKTYRGTDAAAYLVVQAHGSGALYAAIDLKTPGRRTLSRSANSIALGSDVLRPFSTDTLHGLRLHHQRAINGAATAYDDINNLIAPQWVLTIHGKRLTDPPVGR